MHRHLAIYAAAKAALFLALPAHAGYQAITIHGEDDPTAVATFVTKFEGELHRLDITVEDASVELDVITEEPTNGLWDIESTRPNGATFRLADASANQDQHSRFRFRQKMNGGGGGGGGGKKLYDAIAQQIQISASYPGEPGEEVPRPTSQGEEYYGVVLHENPSKPVRIRLVYNRERYDEFYPSTISLEIASGLKIVNRPPGEDTAAAIAASLHPGTEVTFDVIHDMERVPVLEDPQPVTLILTDQYGEIHEDEVKLGPVEVVPDWNRDGMINDEDLGKASEENPFVFWINDDDDDNAEPHFGDIPGTQVDGADMLVNSPRDLVDFFPVQLRIKAMLKVLPEDEYSYKISHPAGASHFIEMPDVHPDSSPEAQGAGSYLRNQTMADEAMARPMKDTAGDGSELSIEYLDAVKNDMGMLLFESRSPTNQSFELIVTKNGGGEVVRLTRALPVEMVEVEKMFWRSNIRPAAAGQAPVAVVEPTSEKFKASRKDQWFVFCHGYNVSKEAARGWNAEVFKRLHQEGSDAKFVGVTWEGNQGQFDVSLFFEKMFTPDYWRNAYNAFSSSHALATEINALTGGSKSKTVIAAHSLGNMVVSSAICDHGLQAGQYFMFNSAVPREAYSAAYAAQDRGNMRNPDWQNYPTRLWSTDWKDLYAANDGRNKLTWRNRFASLLDKTTPFNYFSTGEDVAAGSVSGGKPSAITVAIKGSGAWISQEMNKGLATKAAINGFATGNWSAGGGWAFNINHYAEYRPNPLDPPPPGGYPNTSAITDGQLRANPFFKPFTKLKLVNGGANPAADGTDITTPAGDAHASEYVIRAWMLAHEIPSLSLPTASGDLPGVIMGTDMENEFKTGNWGNEKWTHSAMRERDPTEVYELYENMCDKGNLRKP